MARDSKTLYPYPILGPFMDQSVPAMRLNPQKQSVVTGADGRFLGTIRKYPGNLRIKDLTTIGSRTAITNISFFKFVTIRKGTSGDLYSGWVVRYNYTAVTGAISFFHYDESGSVWAVEDIVANGASHTAKMDCDTWGRFLYTAIEGSAPTVTYYDTVGSAWTTKNMGAGVYITGADNMPEATLGTLGTGGFLSDGIYFVAYRFYDSQREIYSALSDVKSITLSGATDTQKITVTIQDALDNGGAYFTVDPRTIFDKVQIFRSIGSTTAGAGLYGGVYYEETTVAHTSIWDDDPDGDGLAFDAGQVSDNSLVTRQPYQPYADVVEAPPQSGAIHHFQGVNFMSRAAADSGGGEGLRWSLAYLVAPENFQEDRVFRDRLEDGQLLQFVEAGDLLYGLSKSVIYRILKSTNGMDVQKIHYGRGITGYGAAHGVGRDVFLVCPLGLATIEGISGRMDLLTAPDRIIKRDWLNNLDSVESGYDSNLGCSFFVNKTDNEAICLWHKNKTVSKLEDCYFSGVSMGPHPVNGGAIQAHFITDEGLVLTPDAFETGEGNMLDVQGTTDGTSTSDGAADGTTIVDSGGNFHPEVINSYVHILTGDCAGESKQITSRNSTTLTTTAAFSAKIVSGVRYSISPVPFRVRFKPVPAIKAANYDFERRKMAAIGAHVQNLSSGWGSNDNRYVTMGYYRDGGTTLAVSSSTLLDANPADMWVATPVSGVQVEPSFEHISSGIIFELTGIQVRGTYTVSRNDADG